ncbi:MAG TPA: putative manganese-dependent inorganic diphosphatase [Erysipelothrix sp.]|nr:putative manganese-dependent inorganic diphosphatase [Erysipelothrix sp.]
MINRQDLVFVVGHKYPDTDSIVSAIAYAHLKQMLGINAVACRLGPINDETEYLLERFNETKPLLLKDAKATLEEIEMDDVYTITIDTTIREAMDIMEETGRQALAVVNDKNQLLGVITNSDLSNVAVGDTNRTIDMLSRTSVENITKTIEGRLVYAPLDFSFNGKVSIVAIASTRLTHYELENRLVIIGNDVNAQINAIEKGAAGIITVWTDSIAPQVIEKAKEYECAVIMSSLGTLNTSRYLFFSATVNEVMTTDPIFFNKSEFVEDVGRKMLNTRYRAYPVLDDQNRVYGFVSRYHVLNRRSKRLILVDHNEYSQAVDGADEAEILEVIDHHRIGDLSTTKPILFRNEIIGSTASIITKIYRENNLEIPTNIAALLLAALISDTLNLKSPTTTPQDFEIAKYLSEVSALDRDMFAKDIFEVTSSLRKKSYHDIITQDIKKFTISGQHVMVSQVVVYEFSEVRKIVDDFEKGMDEFVKGNYLDLLVVVFTSVSDNGSIILGAGELKDAVKAAFPKGEGEKIAFFSDVVSRKNQIIPQLSVAISQYI